MWEKRYNEGMSDNPEQLTTVPAEGLSMIAPLAGNPLANVLSNKESLEALASIYIAKQMPRNMMEVSSKIRQLCSFRHLANTAFFEYKRGDSSISGETIHLANACLTAYGNAEAGWRKIGEHVDEKGRVCSDCIAFCWDKENNIRREIAFSVPHYRDTKTVDILLHPIEIFMNFVLIWPLGASERAFGRYCRTSLGKRRQRLAKTR